MLPFKAFQNYMLGTYGYKIYIQKRILQNIFSKHIVKTYIFKYILHFKNKIKKIIK